MEGLGPYVSEIITEIKWNLKAWNTKVSVSKLNSQCKFLICLAVDFP